LLSFYIYSVFFFNNEYSFFFFNNELRRITRISRIVIFRFHELLFSISRMIIFDFTNDVPLWQCLRVAKYV